MGGRRIKPEVAHSGAGAPGRYARLVAAAVVFLLLGCLNTAAQGRTAGATATMLVAVSRDRSLLVGGMEGGSLIPDRKLDVEPIARLTSSGKFIDIPCSPDSPAACRALERGYLNRPHDFTVVSGDGYGARVHEAPAKLGDCYEYNGTGTFSGAEIAHAAIAAANASMFGAPPRMRQLSGARLLAVRAQFLRSLKQPLRHPDILRIFTVTLDRQRLYVAERTMNDPIPPGAPFIFAVFSIDAGGARIFNWTGLIHADEQRVLGAVRLRDGPGLLITAAYTSESQSFVVYTLHSGKLATVFSGGGNSC